MRFPSPFSAEEEKFIEENIKGTSRKKMVAMLEEKFGTEHDTVQVKNFLSKKHLKSGLKRGWQPGENWKVYPPQIQEYIKANYVGVGPKEMAERIEKEFGLSFSGKQMHAFYHNHGLSSGLSGHFEKGKPSWNKGKKLPSKGGTLKTQFKPGNVPHNTAKIGTVLKKADGYLWRKISEENGFSKNWKQEHIIRWEEENGPVPEGHCLIFLDGNRENVELSNLRLVTRGELASMTRLHLRSEDPDITETGILIARLSNTVYRKKKGAGKNGKRSFEAGDRRNDEQDR